MAKCTVIGETPKQPRKLKEIEFVLEDLGEIGQRTEKTLFKPNAFANIELVRRAFDDSFYDIMFAYTGSRKTGAIFYGHWNDGGHYDDQGNWVS